MDRPQPFIVTDKHSKLTINDHVAEQVAKIEDQLVIVAIVGKYRTGKSYLLNSLMGKNCGFPLGATVESETKGIWIWFQPHPKDPTKQMVLIDTEGLADPKKADLTHDIWIYSLAILLSSMLVYNSTGTIDNASINELHMTSELTEHLKMKIGKEEEGQEFDRIFPMFIWAVRDFFLKPEINGKMVSPNEYLEDCLSMKRGLKRETKEANYIKQCIRTFFKQRHCFLFPCPANDKEKLQHLETLKESELEKEFLEVGLDFKNFVYHEAPVKKIEGKSVNGRMFINFCKCYVDAIREGKIPCIESAVAYISKVENAKAMEDAFKIFDEEISRLELPVMEEELNVKHQSAQQKAMESFSSRSVFDKSQDYQQLLAKGLGERYMKLVTKNEDSSTKKCKAILKDLYGNIEQQIKEGKFLRPGGYQSYVIQMEKLEREYRGQKGKGIKENVVYIEFVKEKQVDQKQILNADEKLKDEERKVEKERIKASQAEMMRIAKEEDLDRAIKKMEHMERHYEKGMEQYKRDLERKTETQIDIVKKTIEEQQKEQNRLHAEGFKDEAQLMRQQIQELQNELREKKERSKELNREFQKHMMEEFKEMNKRHAEHMKELIGKIQNQSTEQKDVGLAEVVGTIGKVVDVATKCSIQ